MFKAIGVLRASLLTLIISASSASAQLGPWVEPAPEQAPVQAVQPEPIIDLVSTTQIKSVPLATESKPLGLPRAKAQSQPLGNNDVKTPIVLGKDFARTLATPAGVPLLIFALAHLYKRIADRKSVV